MSAFIERNKLALRNLCRNPFPLLHAFRENAAVRRHHQNRYRDRGQHIGIITVAIISIQRDAQIRRQFHQLRVQPVHAFRDHAVFEDFTCKSRDKPVVVFQDRAHKRIKAFHIVIAQAVGIPFPAAEGERRHVDEPQPGQPAFLFAKLFPVGQHGGTAHGPAHQDHVMQVQGHNDFMDILRQPVNAVPVNALGRTSVTAQVKGHHRETVFQPFHVLFIKPAGAAPAVNQDNRAAAAFHLVINMRAVADFYQSAFHAFASLLIPVYSTTESISFTFRPVPDRCIPLPFYYNKTDGRIPQTSYAVFTLKKKKLSNM